MTNFEDWDETQPIYRQLREKIVNLIIEGALKEGEAVPSVRQVASEYRINHLTVSKAYQELVDDGLLQKRRGLGMFVEEGAQKTLLQREKARFIETEVPILIKRMQQLGISAKDLIDLFDSSESEE
jgi:GntR family transcriptional regulator